MQAVAHWDKIGTKGRRTRAKLRFAKRPVNCAYRDSPKIKW